MNSPTRSAVPSTEAIASFLSTVRLMPGAAAKQCQRDCQRHDSFHFQIPQTPTLRRAGGGGQCGEVSPAARGEPESRTRARR